MENHEQFSLGVSSDSFSYQPWDFESRSKGGFLLGDPLCCLVDRSSGQSRVVEASFDFVLNKQSVLRSYHQGNVREMLYLDKLIKAREGSKTTTVEKLAFSLNGETVYVVSSESGRTRFTAWDVSCGKLIAEKSTGGEISSKCCPLAVREGVLLGTSSGALELWNFELSEYVRRWTGEDVRKITEMILISDERVMCTGWGINGVIILDTTTGDKVSTIKVHYGEFIACNSKCQLISTHDGCPANEIRLWRGQTVLWKNVLSSSRYIDFFSDLPVPGVFSPAEQFILISATTSTWPVRGIYVQDAFSGNTLHRLWEGEFVFHCKFVSDEECVIHTYDSTSGIRLQLFNVRTGELLSVIDIDDSNRAYALTSYPGKCLIATGLRHSKLTFKVIQVNLRERNKDNMRS